MSDKQLADRIVALGVGRVEAGFYFIDSTFGPDGYTRELHKFVRDPRVAMALMEKCNNKWYGVETYQDGVGPYHAVVLRSKYTDWARSSNESLPRAICEACVETLENEN